MNCKSACIAASLLATTCSGFVSEIGGEVTADLDFGCDFPQMAVSTEDAAQGVVQMVLSKSPTFKKLFASTRDARHRAEELCQTKGDVQERITKLNETIANEWMNESYLGEPLRERFEEIPPIALFEPSLLISGTYINESNVILVNPFHHDLSDNERPSPSPGSSSNFAVSIAHEQHHFAAYLGGRTGLRWGHRHEDFRDLSAAYELFLEGITELLAQELAETHGLMPREVAYHPELATAFLIERLVDGEGSTAGRGTSVLRSAYLSGDFTTVRTSIDTALGSGTFVRLVRANDRVGWNRGLCLLTDRLTERGIDYRRWIISSPLMRRLTSDRSARPDEPRLFADDGEALCSEL